VLVSFSGGEDMTCKILLWIVLVIYGITLVILADTAIGPVTDIMGTIRATLFFGALAWLIHYSFEGKK
jgi:hypothetical protein